MPDRAAAIVQADPMREFGPREFAHLEDIVEKFDELVGARSHLAHGRGLLDGGQMRTHVMNAARRWTDNVVVISEISGEYPLCAGRFLLRAAIRHRLAAAGLLLRIIHFYAQTFEQFEGRDTDFGIERIDKTGNEQSDFHWIGKCGEPEKRRISPFWSAWSD